MIIFWVKTQTRHQRLPTVLWLLANDNVYYVYQAIKL